MGTESQTDSVVAPSSVRTLARRGAVALVVAVGVNLGIAAIGTATVVTPGFEPFVPFFMARGTVVGVLGGVSVYGVLGRFRDDPDRLFGAFAVGFLLVSLVPVALRAPTLPGASTPGLVLLAGTHVVAGTACVVAVTDFGPWP